MSEFKSAFGTAGCFVENVGELFQEFDTEYVGEDGKVIKLSGEAVFALMADFFGKIQETSLECLGKEIEVEFGDTATANLMEQLVRFVLQFANQTNPTLKVTKGGSTT